MTENNEFLYFGNNFPINQAISGPKKSDDIPHVFERPVQVFGRERVLHPFTKVRKSWATRALPGTLLPTPLSSEMDNYIPEYQMRPLSSLTSNSHIITSSFESSGEHGYSFPRSANESRQCFTADPEKSFIKRLGTKDSIPAKYSHSKMHQKKEVPRRLRSCSSAPARAGVTTPFGAAGDSSTLTAGASSYSSSHTYATHLLATHAAFSEPEQELSYDELIEQIQQGLQIEPIATPDHSHSHIHPNTPINNRGAAQTSPASSSTAVHTFSNTPAITSNKPSQLCRLEQIPETIPLTTTAASATVSNGQQQTIRRASYTTNILQSFSDEFVDESGGCGSRGVTPTKSSQQQHQQHSSSNDLSLKSRNFMSINYYPNESHLIIDTNEIDRVVVIKSSATAADSDSVMAKPSLQHSQPLTMMNDSTTLGGGEDYSAGSVTAAVQQQQQMQPLQSIHHKSSAAALSPEAITDSSQLEIISSHSNKNNNELSNHGTPIPDIRSHASNNSALVDSNGHKIVKKLFSPHKPRKIPPKNKIKLVPTVKTVSLHAAEIMPISSAVTVTTTHLYSNASNSQQCLISDSSIGIGIGMFNNSQFSDDSEGVENNNQSSSDPFLPPINNYNNSSSNSNDELNNFNPLKHTSKSIPWKKDYISTTQSLTSPQFNAQVRSLTRRQKENYFNSLYQSSSQLLMSQTNAIHPEGSGVGQRAAFSAPTASLANKTNAFSNLSSTAGCGLATVTSIESLNELNYQLHSTSHNLSAGTPVYQSPYHTMNYLKLQKQFSNEKEIFAPNTYYKSIINKHKVNQEMLTQQNRVIRQKDHPNRLKEEKYYLDPTYVHAMELTSGWIADIDGTNNKKESLRSSMRRRDSTSVSVSVGSEDHSLDDSDEDASQNTYSILESNKTSHLSSLESKTHIEGYSIGSETATPLGSLKSFALAMSAHSFNDSDDEASMKSLRNAKASLSFESIDEEIVDVCNDNDDHLLNSDSIGFDSNSPKLGIIANDEARSHSPQAATETCLQQLSGASISSENDAAAIAATADSLWNSLSAAVDAAGVGLANTDVSNKSSAASIDGCPISTTAANADIKTGDSSLLTSPLVSNVKKSKTPKTKAQKQSYKYDYSFITSGDASKDSPSTVILPLPTPLPDSVLSKVNYNQCTYKSF